MTIKEFLGRLFALMVGAVLGYMLSTDTYEISVEVNMTEDRTGLVEVEVPSRLQILEEILRAE